MNIILIILVFGVIIFFHELGHFIVAKMNHITVKEFSMGLGPKLFSFKKKETQYSLRLIPLGGYCMMLSEDEEENENDENSFDKKSIQTLAFSKLERIACRVSLHGYCLSST